MHHDPEELPPDPDELPPDLEELLDDLDVPLPDLEELLDDSLLHDDGEGEPAWLYCPQCGLVAPPPCEVPVEAWCLQCQTPEGEPLPMLNLAEDDPRLRAEFERPGSGPSGEDGPVA